MRTYRCWVVLLAVLAGPALAQVEVRVSVPLPTIRFEVAPPLVVVSPGLRVVPDYDDEVFFVDGWYWCRRDDHWFRARSHGGEWVAIAPGKVPSRLVKVPHGKYKHYRAERGHGGDVHPAKHKGKGGKKGKGG
jgi:hypothetical protein